MKVWHPNVAVGGKIWFWFHGSALLIWLWVYGVVLLAWLWVYGAALLILLQVCGAVLLAWLWVDGAVLLAWLWVYSAVLLAWLWVHCAASGCLSQLCIRGGLWLPFSLGHPSSLSPQAVSLGQLHCIQPCLWYCRKLFRLILMEGKTTIVKKRVI